MTKQKLKWYRDGADPFEPQYLAPDGWDPDTNGANDHIVAWIDTHYSPARFYHGRGGMGTSRPDGYKAFVGYQPGRALAVPGSAVGKLGPSFVFSTLRAAKQAVAVALAKTVPIEPAVCTPSVSTQHGGAWQSVDELPSDLCMDDETCSACGGPLVYLGTLGIRDHYRCRNCGLDTSQSFLDTSGSL